MMWLVLVFEKVRERNTYETFPGFIQILFLLGKILWINQMHKDDNIKGAYKVDKKNLVNW